MAQIRLTNGNDIVTHTASDANTWNDYFGEQGDDRILQVELG